MASHHHYHFNVFRILGDVSHTASKCILIWAIHNNHSAEGQVDGFKARNILTTDTLIGISLITQGLYAIVFCSRYLDLFWSHPLSMPWNFVLKIFYIGSSFYILALMMRVYARTREREKAWKMGGFCLAGSMVAAPLVLLIFKHWHKKYLFSEVIAVRPRL